MLLVHVGFDDNLGSFQEIVLNNERNGRPILIGTANVKMSEAIVSRLREAGVEPQLLNARPESIARENETISQAGGGHWRWELL